MTNWLENHQLQTTHISYVVNAPFIQNSNQMASSVDRNRKFSERILLTPAIFKACGMWVSEWHICISESPQETRFYASRFHEFKNG